MNWLKTTALQFIIYILVMFIILYGTSNLSLGRFILAGLFYLTAIGFLNYKKK